MDTDISILFVVSASKRLTRSTLKVDISDIYNRKLLYSDKEQEIKDIWQRRVEENPKLFNGTKFRIDSMTQDTTLNVGVTCYRDYLGTNWSPRVKELLELGQNDHNNPQVYMSDPLGVGSLVVTSDDRVIFLKRSKHCAEAPDMWDVPGGHAEPEVSAWDDGKVSLPPPPPLSLSLSHGKNNRPWCDGSCPHGGPIDLFLISASGLRLM